jgi:hypothetical protein
MDTSSDFNLQTHLIQMESRIREDIRQVGDLAKAAQAAADDLSREISVLKERVDTLDTNIRYVYRGVWVAVVALVGFVWNRFIGKI